MPVGLVIVASSIVVLRRRRRRLLRVNRVPTQPIGARGRKRERGELPNQRTVKLSLT
jgi:hypothetical protein